MIESEQKISKRTRNTVFFIPLVALWLGLDIATKRFFNTHFSVGEETGDLFAGLFHIRLVHNTGAAWGMFSESTKMLAIVSICISVLILLVFFSISKRATLLEVLGLGLILAGGIGNGIDRLALGYVIDFIEFSFIDFPVFNIADIGVTCGFLIVLFTIFFNWRKEDSKNKYAKE